MKFLPLFLLILFPATSWACKCLDYSQHYTREKLENAEKAYVGKIIAAQVLGDGSKSSATLKVIDTFKGDVYDLEEVINKHTSCGVRIELNATYLVYENKNSFVNFCTMSNIYGWGGSSTLKEVEYLKTLQP